MIERLIWAGLITFTISLLVDDPAIQMSELPSAVQVQPSQQVARLLRNSDLLQNLFQRRNYGM